MHKYKICVTLRTITSWEIDGETMETVSDFIFWGSKISADGDCSHEIKRRLLLRRKVMTNMDSILKSRDITLPTKVHLVKAMVFPVVMNGWELDYEESWAPGEGEGGIFRENSIETCILSRVKEITNPGWMHETSARAWCTGKTQRDRVEREVGGGIGMGNTWIMADSCQCMTKTTTIL